MKTVQSLLAIGLAALSTLIMANDKTDPKPDQPITDAEACALPSHAGTTALDAFKKSDSEWQKILTEDQFRVMRQHGTEPSFRNAYWNNKDKGLYLCAGCQAPLFASGEKYNSGTGWPSFWDTISPENIGRTVDTSYGMTRVEVHCNRCGGHLGHVFEDGPRPTNLRYCINSASLEFVPKADLRKRELDTFAKHAK